MSDALVINVFQTRGNGDPQQYMLVTDTPTPLDGVPNEGVSLPARADQDPFASLMKEPFSRQVIMNCGDALFASLDALPRFSKTELSPAVRTPIYFKLDSPPAENLPWEALWHRGRGVFVALEPNWPLARLATVNNRPSVSLVEPELKILIVLAASRGDGALPVHATGEWTAIWNALSKLPFANRLRVHVLTCQDDIIETIGQLVAPAVQVTCETLVSEQTLRQAVAELSPNIVHFFCHGSTEGDEPRLNLATRGDFDAELPTGRIWLGLNELSTIGKSPSIWLVTLNCCQGAQAPGSRASIAAKIAATVPTVVAMRESVDFRKAHVFAGAFYEHLLQKLEPHLPNDADANAGTASIIPADVWVDAMHPPRQALSSGAGAQDPAWTLPVVYVQRGGLMLKAQPRSASVITLLPEADRIQVTGLRSEWERTSAIAQAAASIEGTPPSVRETFENMTTAALRRADEAERDALEKYLQTPDLTELRQAMAQTRLDDLQKRLA